MDTAERPSLLVVDAAPGNIGAVLQVLSRAGFSARLAQPSDLDVRLTQTEQPAEHATSLQAVERNHIIAVLKKAHGVIEGRKGAALLLDLKPSTTRFRMKKLGITKADYLPKPQT